MVDQVSVPEKLRQERASKFKPENEKRACGVLNARRRNYVAHA